MGSGEHGRKAELQAVWAPWSYTCDRMSEVAFFTAYFMGKSYTPVSSGTPQMHEINHLLEAEMDLPTFTMEYGTGGTGNNVVYTGCVVNEYSITFAAGGNGVVEATFSGWGNKHRKVGGAFAQNVAGNMATGTFDFSSEPLLNFKCLKAWIADTMDDVDANSVSISGPDIGTNIVDITSMLNSVTMTGNNGMTAADKARAGGCGIVNDYVRGDREFTLEVNFRKNDSNINTDTLILANTQKAMEFQFNGPYIDGTNPYAVDFLYPVVQFTAAPEDTEKPIGKAGALEVFQDTNDEAKIVFVQSAVTSAYNS